MKITAIDSFVLSIPPVDPMALEVPEHRLVVALLHTDGGISGLGYTLAFGGGGAEAIRVYLETRLKPLLIDQNPLMVGGLWRKMFLADRGIKRQGIAAYALSALDIGLWDIVGKAANLSLYKLWGGVTDRIPAYGSGGWPNYSTEQLIAEAQGYVSRGFRYYKMKIHDPDPMVNRRRVAAVREAVGDGIGLMVDVKQKLDVLGNIRKAEALRDLGLEWYEEPVLADDLAACAEVARAIAIPVATGENNYTRFEFRDLIERRAARYLMPDVCRANGFSETLRIAALAAAHSVRVTPHVVHELSIHVLGAIGNGFLAEFIDWVPPDLFAEMPSHEDGNFLIPDRPGHGMALAPDAERKYRLD